METSLNFISGKELGKDYRNTDLRNDPSGFLSAARLHQSIFRATKADWKHQKGYMNCATYGNMLTDEDAKTGANFYPGLGIFDEVKNDSKQHDYNENVWANMLRSEHVPFNFFIPLSHSDGVDYFRKVLENLLKKSISSIDEIAIEKAPKIDSKHGKWYLSDRTAFDTYVSYTSRGRKCVLGIEIKYTEREYPLQQEYPIIDKDGQKVSLASGQYEAITKITTNSVYYLVTKASKLYKKELVHEMIDNNLSYQEKKLLCDNYRQMWRNHILGASMLLYGDCQKFTSVLIYPSANKHFAEHIPHYKSFLNNPNDFVGITYEQFFDALEQLCPDKAKYMDWITYLRERYVVTEVQ